MYRAGNNLNDLINRFEVNNDSDFDMSESVRYARGKTRRFKDESFGNDETRSLMKFTSDKIFDASSLFVQQTPTASGVKEFVKQLLLKVSALLEMISRFPFPRMSVMSFGITSLLAVFLAPKAFTERALYPGFKILFTVVYPAYRSFKAVKNKNLKEYLKWIVYWIVYAFFTCIEMVTDALLCWFPFYYEIKVTFLIWLLGPSSKGSMKVYKNIIHPMLVSREREIDNVIQLAQDYGYMQVFRLSSKSVNYANKIIMQDASADSNMIVSHQLMKNISLSNVSDAGTIPSSDEVEENFRLRRFSLDKAPIFAQVNNQANYSYENAEQRRKPSFDYRYDDMSSGYASPTQPLYRSVPQQQRGAFIEENIGSSNDLSRKDSFHSERVVPRKASLAELSDDEIIIAYHNLLKHKLPESLQQPQQKVVREQKREEEEDVSDNYREFLKWMEMKRNGSEKNASTTTIKTNEENPATSSAAASPPAIPLNGDREREEKKVNKSSVLNDDAIAIVADEVTVEAVAVDTTVESDAESEEFVDAIAAEDERDYLNVSLVIRESDDEGGDAQVKINEDVIIPTIVADESSMIKSNELSKSEIETERSAVTATLTLSNDPLQITANLSASSVSLVSSNDETKKKPARHGKGRAPPPPPPQAAASSTSNVIEGYFYDELTKRHFKETEL